MTKLQSDIEKPQEQDASRNTQLALLVVKAQQGNGKAFEQLFARFQKEVYRMVYYRTRSQQDAEDLTQEVFIRAYKKISGLKEAGRFRTWLFSIAFNRIRDFYRKKRIQNLFSLSALEDDALEGYSSHDRENPGPIQNLIKQDFWKQVEKFLGRLSKMEREVFLLRFLDQLMITEISRVLKKSESTVKTHLYRALVKFKKASSIIEHLQEESRE
jgi:RNA polymerase sigma-70 factor (ECF subfamily)